MKTKENFFKNINDLKKTNLQVMYVRDFRVSILVCKDCKIKPKTLKIPVILLILFSLVYSGLSDYSHCVVM